MSSEKKSLLEANRSKEDDRLHYSATNGHVTIQQRELTPTTSRKGVADISRRSALSGDGSYNASMLGSVVQPQDLQELMSNLERATGLVKRYLQENQGLDTGRKYAIVCIRIEVSTCTCAYMHMSLFSPQH